MFGLTLSRLLSKNFTTNTVSHKEFLLVFEEKFVCACGDFWLSRKSAIFILETISD